MAKITLNDSEIEAPDGAPLVEVIKNQGTFISNLCYVDGLPPYAGCRTCIVEIEGARGYQLSCTSKVTDGMVVRTQTPELHSTRQAVLSLIMSYHSDRCLTCHRIVKCKPGDTCLRDDTVTHRCLTCSKNYRCELQTTCEQLKMAGYEPWDGDERTYYTHPQPQPDQANPFLEFDPQMCIICTRCVRACDEIRHTGAITLAGRGFSTRIAFGEGGAVHDSNCDFCGACIDVCPTATLMEHPNKWGATQTEHWTDTTCTQCSVGCSISIGQKNGKAVIMRPDQTANPVSATQVCVRGRFHYDAIKRNARLGTPLIKRNGGQDTSDWNEAMEFTAARLAQVREAHGPDAIGFLGSPLATNEENYLLGKIARAIVGTNNIDTSTGGIMRAAANPLREAFGSEVLPADGTRISRSKTILVVADDLDSSHNVFALRVKDANVRGKAKVVVVASIWGELNDFAAVWVQPKPGDEAAIMAAIAAAVEGGDGSAGRSLLEPTGQAAFDEAVKVLAAAKEEDNQPFTALVGLPHFGASDAGAIVGATANMTMALAGEDAKNALFVMPPEANGWGVREMGVTPDYFPGGSTAGDAARDEMQRLWGAQVATSAGMTFDEMAASGRVKALVVMNDNPLMLAPDRARVERMLGGLEFLAVVDSLQTDTANRAHAVLAEAGYWAKEGTTTNADRRILRMAQAHELRGDAQQGWRILSELGRRLAERFDSGEMRIIYPNVGDITNEIAQVVPTHAGATWVELDSGMQAHINGAGPTTANRVAVQAAAMARNGRFTLASSRSYYTSYEGAAIHSPDADKLHREDNVILHPDDAAALGVKAGDAVTLSNERGSLRVPVEVRAIVHRKALFLPLYYDGGAVTALFAADARVTEVDVAKA
ncbi:MAG TPA: molybdopterin-dependent oxidoreductase [Dehalococcoidia bacterium]|nr:molybdopterin-dependent oxidoreductase [Dehalococcoidia bacterium]